MQTSNQGTTQKHAGLYKFRQVMDKVMNGVFFFCGAVSIAAVLLITVYLVIAGLPAIGEIGIVDFLFGTEWASTAAEPKFGILPFILTSVWGMLGASLLGVPVGLMCAVYLSKVASKRAAGIVRPAVELLSGIPSVVYGLVGMMVFKVSIPAAKSGIAAGIVLGIGRAVGEAMAVMMVAGNVANMPGLFKSVTFLTTAVAKEMSYAGGLQRQALVSIALVLFCFIMVINAVLNIFLKRGEKNG